VKFLANIKSAKKRIAVNTKKQLRNKSIKSSTKTAVKKVLSAVQTGDKTQATEAHRLAVKAIDQAASKGIYHKNTASRKKSQLARLVNQ
jgi:small subunit ribosomal protein S20